MKKIYPLIALAIVLGLTTAYSSSAFATSGPNATTTPPATVTYANVTAYFADNNRDSHSNVIINGRAYSNSLLRAFHARADRTLTETSLISIYPNAAGYAANPNRTNQLFAEIGGTIYTTAALESNIVGGVLTLPAQGAQLASTAPAVQNSGANNGASATRGFGATAVGFGADASGTDSHAFGQSATASGSSSIAIGRNTTASNSSSIAIGKDTTSSGERSTAIGDRSSASNTGASAIGTSTIASGQGSTAIGFEARATAINAAAIGYFSQASNTQAIAIGTFSIANALATNAIGFRAIASGESANAIGTSARASGIGSNAIGLNARALPRATATYANVAAYLADGDGEVHRYVAINGRTYNNSLLRTSRSAGTLTDASLIKVYNSGADSGESQYVADPTRTNQLFAVIDGTVYQTAVLERNISNGVLTLPAQGERIVGTASAFGNNARALAVGSTALGQNTTASGDLSTALGTLATASGAGAKALGTSANASGISATAIGTFANASSLDTNAIGSFANASGVNANAFGRTARASGESANAFGSFANASGVNANAFGRSARASGVSTTAIGTSARASGTGSNAIGFNAKAIPYPIYTNVAAYLADENRNNSNYSFVVEINGRGYSNKQLRNFHARADRTLTNATLMKSYSNAAEYVADSNRTNQAFAEIDGIIYATAPLEYAILDGVLIAQYGRQPSDYGNTSASAFGNNAQALNSGATAIGQDTEASGRLSTALGYKAASGYHSTALGAHATASGISSTALGSFATASDHLSTALGGSATASGQDSTALGVLATASGQRSIALGYRATASGQRSIALGYGSRATRDHQIVFGTPTRAYSFSPNYISATTASTYTFAGLSSSTGAQFTPHQTTAGTADGVNRVLVIDNDGDVGTMAIPTGGAAVTANSVGVSQLAATGGSEGQVLTRGPGNTLRWTTPSSTPPANNAVALSQLPNEEANTPTLGASAQEGAGGQEGVGGQEGGAVALSQLPNKKANTELNVPASATAGEGGQASGLIGQSTVGQDANTQQNTVDQSALSASLAANADFRAAAATNADLRRDVDKLSKEVETNTAGVASAVAIASLPNGNGRGLSLALGSFEGETAIAAGLNFDMSSTSRAKITVSTSDGQTSGGVGMVWDF